MVLCIAIAALLASIAEAQQPRCCSFAQFAADPGFRSVHHPPLPFADVDSEKGRWMYLPATTPPVRLYVCGQLESASAGLLLFHEWWGLNEYIRREAEQLSAQLHVPVVAVDLYDGAVTADPQEAARLMQSVSEQRIRRILRTVLEALPARARIPTLGWCFGGGWALQAALEAGARAAACVMYYGCPNWIRRGCVSSIALCWASSRGATDGLHPNLPNASVWQCARRAKSWNSSSTTPSTRLPIPAIPGTTPLQPAMPASAAYASSESAWGSEPEGFTNPCATA